MSPRGRTFATGLLCESAAAEGGSLVDAPKLTVSEAARRLRVHVSSVFRWSLHGVGEAKLPLVRVGGRTFVLLSDLEEFIRRRSDPRPASKAGDDLAARADAAGEELSALGL